MNTQRLTAAVAAACVISAALSTTAAAKAPAGRFTVKSDASGDVVSDALFKLTWQRATAPYTYTLANGKSYCSGLALQGGGWRLPDLRELQGLVDRKEPPPAIDKLVFPETQNEFYWSSTYAPSQSSMVWGVVFNIGATTVGYHTNIQRVRCVR